MLGHLIVDLALDVDQSLGLGTIELKDWTRITPWTNTNGDTEYDYLDLGLPADNLVMSASVRYGRDRFITGDFETGTATVVLNNDTGEWSPTSGLNVIGGDKLAPGTPIRIGYYLYDVEVRAELFSGTSWGTQTTNKLKLDLGNNDTATGLVDGRTWTNHGSNNDLWINLEYTDRGFAGSSESWIHNVFLGRVVSVTDQYEEGGRGAITVIECTDFMQDLAAYSDSSFTWTATNTGSVITAILTDVLNDTTYMWGTVDTGEFTVEAHAGSDANYLALVRLAARAEAGAVFADHAGEQGALVFKDANWLVEDPRSAVVQYGLGAATDRVQIFSATPEFSLLRVYNTIAYSNSSTTTAETDATSIAKYGARALTAEVLNNVNGDLTSIAERDLAILKDAQAVLTNITVKPGDLFEELFAMDVTIGDLLRVTIRNNGWDYSQDLHVAGIAHAFTSDNQWTLQLRLDSRDGDYVIEATA